MASPTISAPGSNPGSPKNRVKFLCSHGGKILPRPADSHLKYVGGETRVISVPRDIPFQELMKKLTYMIDGEMIFKYQVGSEDLDALVSVKSEEDLRHMLDEIDRYENAGAPRLRAFLFPAKQQPVVMENQDHLNALEQRYIDAINGIIRLPHSIKHHPTINASGCSSPLSPDSCEVAMLSSNYYSGRLNLLKVQSSPNICAGQPSPHHYPAGYISPCRPPIGVAPERLVSVRSVGRADGTRYQVESSPTHYYSPTRHNRGGNGMCLQYDEYSHFSDRRMGDRTGSLAMSPVCLSPR